MKRHFHGVDVFTSEPFGGNPLAVFPDAEGIDDREMQRIACEFNLSETTFVLPPQDPANDFRVRIFTPTVELPMAGHPTVGTSLVLARQGRTAGRGASETLRLELGVGLVPVAIESDGDQPVRATMEQPLPVFGAVLEERAALAAALGLKDVDLAPGPAQVVSCGNEFLLVPLRDLATAARARLSVERWERLPEPFSGLSPYVFTSECETADARAHARLFGAHFGVVEDPATGSAAGPLGCYLWVHGWLDAEAARSFVVEQGLEMGRPSRIEVGIEAETDRPGGGTPSPEAVRAVRVGGTCVTMFEGDFEIPQR